MNILETSEQQRLWDRLPQESDQAWAAFREYRDLGLTRSVQRVADILARSTAHIFTYSSKYNWRHRVIAYEKHLDGQRLQVHEDAVRDMARRHAVAGEFIWRKAVKVIEQTPIDKISIREAVAMFRAGTPVERAARSADHPPRVPIHLSEEADETPANDMPAPEPTPEEVEAELGFAANGAAVDPA